MRILKKIIVLLILTPALLLSFYEPAKAVSRFEDIVARSALLAEVDSGTILFEHNMYQLQPVGDFAKIMTLLLAVEALQSGEVHGANIIAMTESAWYDINEHSSTRNIVPGEEMTLLDLMFSAFVGNANEANNMVAEHIAGSVSSFVRRMNSRAAEIGAENTTFANPHGQYDQRQYTTARDQFLIFREAVSNELFLEISGTIRHVTSETNLSDARRLINNNSLLNQAGRYYYRHLVSGATSSLFEGGYSFVGYAESEGLSLISVIFGSDAIIHEDESTDLRNLTETRRLLDWGFSNFGIRSIISSSELITRVPVEHGAGADFVNLRPESSIELLLDKAIPLEEFVRDIVIFSEVNDEPLVAPIQAGEVLGEVTISRNGFEYGTILLIANTGIELHRFQLIRMQIVEALESTIVRNIIIVLAILVFIYLVLIIRYNVIRQKRLAAIRRNKQKLIDERQHRHDNDMFD